MGSSVHGLSIANALHRVFIGSIEQSQIQFTRRPVKFTFTQHSKAVNLLPIQQRRWIRDSTTKAERSRLPRNDEITDKRILVVTEDGKLSSEKPTRQVMKGLNLKTHHLVMVQPAKLGEAWNDMGTPAICKIIDKRELYQKEKVKKKSNPGAVTKELELNWALEPNDLAHRLLRIREFLEKGHKLEITLAPKRKGKLSTLEEAQELVAKIRETVGEIEGAKESNDMAGKLLGTATLYFTGKAMTVTPPKTIEIKWSGVDDNELDFKMKAIKDALQKGSRLDVNLVYKRKKGPVAPSTEDTEGKTKKMILQEEGERLIKMIRDAASEARVEEIGETDGDVTGTIVLSFQRAQK